MASADSVTSLPMKSGSTLATRSILDFLPGPVSRVLSAYAHFPAYASTANH